MNILIDYLTLSIKNYNLSKILEYLKIANERYTLQNKSFFGTESCIFFGGIQVHFNNTIDSPFSDIIIINMSGKGCRLLETLFDNNLDWIDFIEHFMSMEGSHLARLDVAGDDIAKSGEKGILSFSTMARCTMQNRFICLSRTFRVIDGSEQMIIFGSTKSDRRLRIYNKAMERHYTDGTHWIRAEFQLRNEAALSFYMRAFERHSIGKTYSGMLYDYLRFTREINKDKGHNTIRMNVCRWWLKFCNTAEKIKGFYIGGVEYNENQCTEYLRRQVSSSAVTYLTLHNNNIDDLLNLFSGAVINKRQEFLIKTKYLENCMKQKYQDEYEEFKRFDDYYKELVKQGVIDE